MDAQIALFLLQDGVTTGVVYALLALALVMVFVVTRVLFLPQGEFVSYAALTLAILQTGAVPATVWFVLATAAAAAIFDLVEQRPGWRGGLTLSVQWLAAPIIMSVITVAAAPLKLPLIVQALLTVAMLAPLGPILYRLAFERLQSASMLVLLIVAIAVHLAMVGFGLAFFGAEGWRTPPFIEASFNVGATSISGQSVAAIAVALALMVALYLFFGHTLLGKALRATGMHRLGARLMAISATLSGRLVFLLASTMGAVSGVLIAPLTTIYYDSGFLIGLKGFVGAVIGGLASYPLTVAGALAVGILESWSSFTASAFKEVIVFTLIIPFLLWLNLRSTAAPEEGREE
jgi:branched-chain amino acid transport system permease protein